MEKIKQLPYPKNGNNWQVIALVIMSVALIITGLAILFATWNGIIPGVLISLGIVALLASDMTQKAVYRERCIQAVNLNYSFEGYQSNLQVGRLNRAIRAMRQEFPDMPADFLLNAIVLSDAMSPYIGGGLSLHAERIVYYYKLAELGTI